MFLKNSPNSKENGSRRSIKARKSINSALNASLIDKENIGGLNDQLTGYIDYVRTIESTNEILKNEKQTLIDSFEKEVNLVKSTYGDEIDSLRQALDDVATSKMKLIFENQSLIEEKENLLNKLKTDTSSLNAMKNDIIELQENLSNYRKKLEGYETLKQEFSDISIENNKIKVGLKNEICKSVELENRMVTLTDEIEFYKKLNANSKNTVEKNIFNIQNAIEVNDEAKIHEQVETIKIQLTEDFEHCKEELEKFYEEKCNDFSRLNEKSTTKYNLLYNENKKLKRDIEELRNENYEKANQISTLNNRIANFNEFVEKRDRDNENHLKDIMDENIMLKQNLESKIHEFTEIVSEKIAIEKELYMFKSLLEGEQTRCNIVDASSPKRKRFNKESCEETNFDITAYSNDRVKLFCDDQYNGDFIKLMNDTDLSININEWKIEIVSGDNKDIYCFPNRIIDAKRILKIWRENASVIDDEDNIRMNVSLPNVPESFNCKLTNDMDEIEASFELRMVQPRKILKARMRNIENKEKCAIM